MSIRTAKRWGVAGAVTAAAALVVSVFVGGAAAGASTPKITPHQIKVNPDPVKVGKTSEATFSCQPNPINGSQGPRCYSPAQIRAAYGVAPLVKAGLDGTGKTIVIIDAFQDPYITSDLATFDALFDLPNPTFQIYAPQGLTPYDPNDANQVGWAGEITLDVEWAHAVAPGAKIVLALAKSNDDLDLYNTSKSVVDNNIGDVISQSFGEAETCMDPTLLGEQHTLFGQARSKGMTVFASSGDSGASQFNCAGTAAIKAASTPASDPNVTGVGGTTLKATFPEGTYQKETAWTEPLFGCNPPATGPNDINCSGGGLSTIYSRPAFQSSINAPGNGRGVPDVAYNAGINGGVLAVCSACDNGVPNVFLFGGTSAGSPQWAAITAIGDQMAHRRLGYINDDLYKISKLSPSAFHDITAGNNYVSEINFGFNAKAGWDAVTGLGSPNASSLLPLLINFPPST